MAFFTTVGHANIDNSYHQAVAPELVITRLGGVTQLEVHAGVVHYYELIGNSLNWQEVSILEGNYTNIQVNGQYQHFESRQLELLETESTASLSRSQTLYISQSGNASDAANMLCVSVEGNTFLIAGFYGQSGIHTLSRNALNDFDLVAFTADTDTAYSADPNLMASIQVGSRQFVLVASQNESGVSAYEIDTTGTLTLRDSLGANEGVGIHIPSAMLTIEVAGQPMVLLGAAGTGTITVMGLDQYGNLTLLDQEMDTLYTRFDGISVMEAATLNGRTYIVAGGSDDGLTLFSLLPNGQLSVLNSLADSLALGLNNVNGLALEIIDGVIHVFATSETEAGVSHLTIDVGIIGQTLNGAAGHDTLTGDTDDDQLFGAAGNDQLFGGGGDDFLIDGLGEDSLTGGAGNDVFFLVADEDLDTILDFNIREDKIDLSAWAMLYSVGQLVITSTGDGALITFANEQIRIHTNNGTDLTYLDFIENDLLGLYRPPEADPNIQFVGTEYSDSMTGTAGHNMMDGKAGQDSLTGGAGNDTITGGSGNDMLNGSSGHDWLYGDDGADIINGGTGADRVFGGIGNDIIRGDSSTDVLYGNGGHDSMVGGTGADTLYGNDGNDTLFGNTGLDTLMGGDGNDYLSSGDGVDLVHGDAGDDTIFGRSGWDQLFGDAGHDTIYGSSGVDTIHGDDGDDWISGGSGWDQLFGDAGNDIIYGNIGSDNLFGDAGTDVLYGGTGDDTLQGGSGNDTLYGNQGVDILEGGAGNDALRGGTLRDTFIFNTGHDADTISDFEEQQDILSLSSSLVGGLTNIAQIISQYGSVSSGQVVFDFGNGDTITLTNLTTLTGLEDNIELF